MHSLIESIRERLENHFNPRAARGIRNVFVFDLTDEKTYTLLIDDGTMQFDQYRHPEPDITFITDSATLERIFNGEVSGTTAMMMGDIKAEGDWMVATRLKRLFKTIK
ncbi:SCP2 sterol-binding domain-containing protein [Larsenimonas rhizosphaerae]|uniref:SCP2 sterol-binding domain-containing protein n=1 Tax=Larsenimonas rhizosphaerae TaxID=2944682 RepID=A0AA42CX69_9GAMM|nr:SCP2 sterol-binding domain-containing protein [Larsenimonas rhizosphaerae]MCM2130819.1 SCP2 sterol-binding domain-containing protein [Larsenimonas rhizosphaerae]MCX2523523.1 SCP2 sterol-binding domain-containing protein [Larsenimonas rhizosphaerae]